jgi:hypothetical protein
VPGFVLLKRGIFVLHSGYPLSFTGTGKHSSNSLRLNNRVICNGGKICPVAASGRVLIIPSGVRM